jgi:hypothetical protein
MRETNVDRAKRAITDDAIDEVARALMDHGPAAGFGGRVASRLRRAPAAAEGPGGVAWAARVVAAVALLTVAVALWHANRPGVPPAPTSPALATHTPPTLEARPPASEAAAPATRSPAAAASPGGPPRGPSRADRLWASRAAPPVERVVVAPVARPDPVAVPPLEVLQMTFEDLAIPPLAVEALSDDRPTTRH